MESGYITKQVLEDEIAIKNGEIDYLKQIILDLQQQIKELERTN